MMIGSKRQDEPDTTVDHNMSITESSSSGTNNGKFKVLLFGQLLSLLTAGSAVMSTSLERECDINYPTSQSSFAYVLLSLHLVSYGFQQQRKRRRRRRQRIDVIPEMETTPVDRLLLSSREENDDISSCDDGDETMYHLPFTQLRLQASWKFYFMISVLDVEANYLTYLAFHYTSVTSVMLLGALSIPFCAAFSKLILSRKYDVWNLLGVLICLAGLVISVYSDLLDDGNAVSDKTGTTSPKRGHAPSTNQVLGDIFAMGGAILCGLSDTLFEASVKKVRITEYLGMVGLFGTMFSVLQICILERNFVSTLFFESPTSCNTSALFSLYLANAVFLYLYYVATSYFLLRHDAALMEVSLLTTNLFVVVFVIVAYDSVPSLMFFAALALVVVGVFVYESGTSTLPPPSEKGVPFLSSQDSEISVDDYMLLDETDAR